MSTEPTTVPVLNLKEKEKQNIETLLNDNAVKKKMNSSRATINVGGFMVDSDYSLLANVAILIVQVILRLASGSRDVVDVKSYTHTIISNPKFAELATDEMKEKLSDIESDANHKFYGEVVAKVDAELPKPKEKTTCNC